MEVTPKAPLLNGLLYEAEVDHQFFFVFEAATKRMVGFGDCWPDPIKLPKKGAYVIKYQVDT